MEIASPVAGVLTTHMKSVGDLVESEEVLGIVDETADKPAVTAQDQVAEQQENPRW